MLSSDRGSIDPLDGSRLGSGGKEGKTRKMDTRLNYNIKRHLHEPIKALNVPKLFPTCSLCAGNDMRDEVARDVWELGMVATRE